MSTLNAEDLRRESLRRQFPAGAQVDDASLLGLFEHLGPIQSQVPRSPFVAAAARRPGCSYGSICGLFETARLIKASTLRGTVHTCVAEQYAWTDVVARRPREPVLIRQLLLEHVGPHDLMAEIERYCRPDWRSREEIVEHLREWLAGHDEPAAVHALTEKMNQIFLWSHSGLARRPKGEAWETRTDTLRRSAQTLRPDLPETTFPAALGRLITVHLGAYGPLTHADLLFFFGVSRSDLDAALTALGDQLVGRSGPGTQEYLDLAEPPAGGDPDPGLKLLPEFDGLLLGYAGRNRNRFLTEEQLARVWAKVNGLFSPVVLHDGRMVAIWKTINQGRSTDVEVRMLEPHPVLADDLFDAAVRALETALNRPIRDVRVRR